MKKRRIAGAGLVSVTLGAVGCGEPARPVEVDAAALFAQNRVEAGDAWRLYLEPRALHAAWAPPADSPWRPFYKPTLIAALAVVKDAAGPTRTEEGQGAPEAVKRLTEANDLRSAAIFVDLPGEASVVWGAAFEVKGFQPVVTFNNWPHQKGLLRLERALGALLLHAPTAVAARPGAAAPPVFILERGRLGDKSASLSASVFDNRYFHAASDFPDAERLRSAGITRVVYVNSKGTWAGCEEDDLNAYFVRLRAAGLRFLYASPDPNGALAEVEPSTRTTIFEPARTAAYVAGGTSRYYRSYGHYHHYHSFWHASSGTWGSGASGGGGSGGWST
ncbi:MAG TPA: hypothetical protein VF950_25345 [Planctomycetota bacterium]